MTEEIVLGGGCFWCIEAAFKEVEGVKTVTSGYAGGHTENPSYREVCSGNTGHAEVVKLDYDSATLDLERLLELFFKVHNPTTKNREGPDIGSQYRSIILYQNQKQKKQIETFIEKLQEEHEKEIVTEVQELTRFYQAEEKHQDYFEKNPKDTYCKIHAKPKMDEIRRLEENK